MEIPDDAYGKYDPSTAVQTWASIARNQSVGDSVYIPYLAHFLNPGSVLELGAAVGQVSKIFQDLGFDVLASDYQPFFVQHMKSIGLKAIVIDAASIQEYVTANLTMCLPGANDTNAEKSRYCF